MSFCDKHLGQFKRLAFLLFVAIVSAISASSFPQLHAQRVGATRSPRRAIDTLREGSIPATRASAARVVESCYDGMEHGSRRDFNARCPWSGYSMDVSTWQGVAVSMHVNLSTEMENFIKSKVATGFYSNATEVIRDAVRRMQAEELRAQVWQAAIQRGDDELNRGEGIPYTAKTLSDITDAAVSSMHSGAPMDADVLP